MQYKARKEKQRNKTQKKQKKNNKMADLNPNILVITLNINGLSTPIRKNRTIDTL